MKDVNSSRVCRQQRKNVLVKPNKNHNPKQKQGFLANHTFLVLGLGLAVSVNASCRP